MWLLDVGALSARAGAAQDCWDGLREDTGILDP
jgi:hypothetical protein